METESVFFYVRCARPTRLCKPELNLLKSGKKTLFNYAIGNTMTRRSRHGRIQKACHNDTHKIVQTRIEFIKIGEENTVQLRNWEYDDEGRSWSNTKSLKTWHDTAYKKPEYLARYKSNIQKALTTENARKHSRIQKAIYKKTWNLELYKKPGIAEKRKVSY